MTEFIKLDMGPMSRIPLEGIENLFLGNIPNALALEEQPLKGFWAVLNCTDDPALDYMKTNAEYDMLRLNHWDGVEYSTQQIALGVKFIDMNIRAGVNVLVCCHAGMSRSPGIVLAYLMHRQLAKLTKEQVRLEDLRDSYYRSFNTILKSRPFIQIHPKIDKSIRQYYHLAPTSAKDLIGG